ncbi:helix-turn-helix domain-containing protein [Streptomyces alboflavus]|nr:helix-turn-helix domain-containing protein [Streptomyces alboflavus]
MVQLSWSGQRVPVIAAVLGCSPKTVRCWLHRFNRVGVRGALATRIVNEDARSWWAARKGPYGPPARTSAVQYTTAGGRGELLASCPCGDQGAQADGPLRSSGSPRAARAA